MQENCHGTPSLCHSAGTRFTGKIDNSSDTSDAFVLDFLAALMREIIRRTEAKE
jgi:hypothetical protein